MPFRHLFAQHGSHDFQNQRHTQQLAIVDPDSLDYTGWHEMDFTTAPFTSSTTTSYPQQVQGPKYSTNMDTDIDPLAYLRSSRRQNSTGSNQQQSTLSGDLFTTGPFSYSQLLNMDADLTSLDQSSLTSRTDGDSNMLNDGSTMTTSLCGPDAPCMNFTTLPPIEECTSVPCITQTTSPTETMITSDSVVPLHQRPSLGSRSSTAQSTLRRSSASSNDNQIQSVPLPPRKSRAAAARKQARKSKPAPVVASTIASDDDEEGQATTKSTAPSKADAKQRAKQAHSLVERKYRENLNAKIAQLHNTLESSHYGPRANEDDESDAPSVVPANKVRKSDVLTEAMNYVNQTEVEMRHMENEIQRLADRVRVLEKLVRCEDCSLLKQMVNMQVQAV
ncbi:hypothetical protein LTR99_002939 [Exophiala xenobiotica]|uniref:BHLH domain-containing protein n=1 Tax=Vermiconidia calcicola TaxID=1690605 RepID=A0AAV9QDY1_9PEZI|nr:hypothetical protein LTR92_005679 [Exophiala xenobiotica]KAK5538608.1 hypothetical protein LTR25_004150 [Vermiconidia calcicola]KAK5547903.1 hypothetical protein LTR23_002152 [Chaetothyriales sp. CCFEE 6169]KAK5212853.1 hypothetical protein LTR41_001801 [Exophiala xenobiotica]KAK5268007.1 hypothetical protein LTR96_006552 [Exophiala xenobiotica]